MVVNCLSVVNVSLIFFISGISVVLVLFFGKVFNVC